MGMNDITKIISGYYCIVDPADGLIIDVLQYSPFTGKELSSGFLTELALEVTGELMRVDSPYLNTWCNMLNKMNPDFDPNLIPDDLKYLMHDKSWYYSQKQKERLEHKNGEFCRGLSPYIDSCYSYDILPRLSVVPIQYCPFCGVKLPPEFDQENWWEKEFKTFKWYKDHKLDEWADDYVDDCDWDYADIDESDKN